MIAVDVVGACAGDLWFDLLASFVLVVVVLATDTGTGSGCCASGFDDPALGLF